MLDRTKYRRVRLHSHSCKQITACSHCYSRWSAPRRAMLECSSSYGRNKWSASLLGTPLISILIPNLIKLSMYKKQKYCTKNLVEKIKTVIWKTYLDKSIFLNKLQNDHENMILYCSSITASYTCQNGIKFVYTCLLTSTRLIHCAVCFSEALFYCTFDCHSTK